MPWSRASSSSSGGGSCAFEMTTHGKSNRKKVSSDARWPPRGGGGRGHAPRAACRRARAVGVRCAGERRACPGGGRVATRISRGRGGGGGGGVWGGIWEGGGVINGRKTGGSARPRR